MRRRICKHYKRERPIINFFKQKDNRDGKLYYCNICRQCKSKESNLQHKKQNWKFNYQQHILKEFGISYLQYEKIYKRQNGVCAICEKLNLNGKRLAVDHNHISGQIRGLLSGNCNRGLGMFKENILNLYKAADYLEKHKFTVYSKP